MRKGFLFWRGGGDRGRSRVVLRGDRTRDTKIGGKAKKEKPKQKDGFKQRHPE